MLRPVFFISLIIVALIILVIIILSARLKILIEYNRENNDDNLVISFFMFKGLVLYRYEAPSAEGTGKKKVRSGWIKPFIDLKGLYEKLRKIIYVIVKYLKGRVVLENLSIEIKYGSGDAGSTGIITGLIWSAVGVLDVLVTNNFAVLNRKISVQPDFTGKVLIIDANCIFTGRIVNIIIMALKVLFNIIKAKLMKKTDRWWYS